MTRFAHFLEVSKQLLKVGAIPLLVAVIYATWSYLSKSEPRSLTQWVTPFAGAFFFCMWLFGQYLRASKQVSDAQHFEEISAGIDEIREAIADVRSSPAPSPQAIPTNNLMQQAQHLVHSGNVLAGLLQAGVAFEQAVLEKARRSGVAPEKYRSVRSLIRAFEKRIGPHVRGELESLWRLRNKIVHADKEAVKELEQQPDLISYFEWGVDQLGVERDDF